MATLLNFETPHSRRGRRQRSSHEGTGHQAPFRLLIDSHPDAILVHSNNQIVYVNLACVRLFAAENAEQMLGMDITNLIPESERDVVRRRIEEHYRTGSSLDAMDHVLFRLNGTTVDVNVMAAPLVWNGWPAIQVVFRDTSALKRAQAARVESEQQSALLLNSTAEAIYGLDLAGNCTFCNPACARLLGYQSADDLIGKHMHRLIHHTRPDGTPYPEQECEIYLALRQNKQHHITEELFWRADGSSFPAEYWSYPIYRDGELVGAVVTFLDITERLRAERALRASEETYRGIFDNSLFAIFRSRHDGTLLDVNPAMVRMLGYDSKEELLTRNLERDIYADRHSRRRILNAYRDGRRVEGLETVWRLKDGRTITVRLSGGKVLNADGRLDHYEVMAEDITQRKAAEEQVLFLAYHDPLTKLPNRVLACDRLTIALANARKLQTKAAVLFIDVDSFKTINDSLGHSTGDVLLQRLADVLQDNIRDGDTVARLGGDEFLVILNSIQSDEQIKAAAENFLHAMAGPFFVRDRVLRTTCSIGISVSPDDGHDVETLIKNADTAMYAAKESGRNTWQRFSGDMNARAVERWQLENGLHQALENNELFLAYQPQVEIRSGRIVGVEALVRWTHPDLGPIPASRLIEIAEETGLIFRLGEWVLREACRQARRWQNQGLPAVPIAVNVSAVQLRKPGFCALVEQVLADTQLAPEYLDLELTESVLISNPDAILSLMGNLKDLGVKLTIDDFGTGYSSLSYLHRYPVHKLKIDRSFVQDLMTKPESRSITSTIVNLGKSLGRKVLAEGVETPVQLSYLQTSGCEEIQGYYSGKPMDSELFGKMLQSGPAWTFDFYRFIDMQAQTRIDGPPTMTM